MHFIIKKSALMTGIERASNTVSSKDDNPILKTFNLEAEKSKDVNELRIVSTDLSLGSIARLKIVDIQEPGAICVDAKKLASVVRAAEDSDINIEVTETQAIVKAGRATWHLNVLATEDYPQVPRFDPASAEEVKRTELLDAIKKVQYAAGTEETRPALMMIAFNGSRVAASDGSRLQLADFKGLENLQIPIFSVSNLVRILMRSELETLRVEVKENHILFQIGGDTFSTLRLFDQFPDVEALVLKKAEGNDKKLTMDKTALVEAINRVRIAADAEKKQLDMIVQTPSNGGGPSAVLLSSEDGNGEKAIEEVPCSTDLDPEYRIIVNHTLLSEALDMNPDKQITMLLGPDMKSRRSPILMKGPGLKSVLLQLRPEA